MGRWIVGVALIAAAAAQEPAETLPDARRGFETKLVREARETEPLPEPPPALFARVTYPGPRGEMAAYLGKAPGPGKHPAIVWITGGLPPGGIDASAWRAASPTNDQSAQDYRLAGVVMMYPTFRGGSGNPGAQECFYGEVDDVLAAAEYLAKVADVDPRRIYLGGHSTGATLALLAAAATDRFRAVVAFGPVADPASYGAKNLTYDPEEPREARLRAPVHFLGAIRSPTLVIEGTGGNIDALRRLAKANTNPRVRCLPVEGAGHFDLLAPLNRLLAERIASNAPLVPAGNEFQRAYDRFRTAQREAEDLHAIARLRARGLDLDTPRRADHYLSSRNRAALEAAAKKARTLGYGSGEVRQREDRDGRPYFEVAVHVTLRLGDLDAVFAASKSLARVAAAGGVRHDGWTAR